MSALSDAIRRLYETDPDFEVYAYLADEVEKVEESAHEQAVELGNLSAAAVEEKRRREVAEGKVERIREILRDSPDHYEGDLVFYEWSRLEEVVNR
jgi:hypothetical protein